MSWSPQLCIGEFRPWPESIHVTRDKIDETRRYVPEKYSSAMQCLASIENVKLRELVKELYETAYPEYPSMFEKLFLERIREAGIEVDV